MGRGGYRVGAGGQKKPEDQLTQMVSFRLARRIIAAVRRLSESLGISQAKVIERAILLFEAQAQEKPDVESDPPETPV